ncbi:TIGR02444 family protein [Pseudoalteromonas peptidolytica]|uniref:TIGR02444 family protein n=1 Tax=Pseudoalteromonas peptidolytica F12-50-A1 TaxID=1315280 RepID=A0A8I0MZR2_9GAMM|nr:TIGR02444 family protein [Pseudoalteromonas peptidolytica]MBE0348100.1 hypothetical protein [Pseudoalteromonas peptidolytica F12-50-A1]NLR15700.1 TIGR02444 family protein [Pseudoalteromonas peptidolytica]GEK10590.1 hypothetical protein PPE03_28390 [Pseudoalteromonas peptidolytica]
MLSRQDFWLFSCKFYSRPEMQARLLALQDNGSKNINLCLLLCYLDKLALTVEPEAVSTLIETCKHFDEIILQPQRRIRSLLKAQHHHYEDYQQLRAAMLTAELELEKRQQALLLEVLQHSHLYPLQQGSNLRHYLSDNEYTVLFAPVND